MSELDDPAGRAQIATLYRTTLMDDVIPFWLRMLWMGALELSTLPEDS